MLRRGFFHLCSLYEVNENGHYNRMVVFCIVSGVIVAAGLFWLKIAVPAWHDFEYASRPHLPAPPRPLDDLNNLLVKRNLARGGGIILADTPIKVREIA
jgi:hypothetical protein